MLMVHTNSQPVKSKVKGPPPVPPRPHQTVVAEALAKTRKAVADSKIPGKARARPESVARAKTLDRYSDKSNIPKQNGLARVKSFIRDVISDRSSEEKKPSVHNSRRSSGDSNTLPVATANKKSPESNKIKTCKQILVRSLSTSNRLDTDPKSRVAKSPSFADKALPLRKAPPPPSPRPKLKTVKPPSRCLERNKSKQSPEVSPYSSPIDAKPPVDDSEAPYATVEEANDPDNRLSGLTDDSVKSDDPTDTETEEVKTSQVTEMLISEILAGRNKDESNSVIDKGKDGANLDDLNNHEMLIYELQAMRARSTESVRRAVDAVESEKWPDNETSEPIETLSDDDAYAYILDDDLKSRLRKQYRTIGSMSFHGLPPLPKSLSGFATNEPQVPEAPGEDTGSPPTDLDAQLSYLKKEMAELRQLDLSLLSELWSLGETMAQWRRQLERARLRPAPPPPPPPPPHYLRT